MDANNRSYIAIDLKSYFASVECVERGLNALTTNLVVADETRTDKTICLAVSPSLKGYGLPGRARLFEIKQKVREINYHRCQNCGGQFRGRSCFEDELKSRSDYALDFIIAPPRMSHYIAYSTKIYDIYLKYIAPEDIHVYSIDEVFIDATNYLENYKMTARELAMRMIRDVLNQTGITATAGIGPNLYLCKIAMDIVAKHIPADENGVRIAELSEMSYRRQLWSHRPLTSFWRIGTGTARRLASYGIYTMGDIARCSVVNDEILYKMFGVNAELLIDHAWGWEPCRISDIKAYQPSSHSMSNGQVLHSAYDYEKARVVVQEMADSTAMSLLEKRLLSNQFSLYVGYDTTSLSDEKIRAEYEGVVLFDHYGRPVPRPSQGMVSLPDYTSSLRQITDAVMHLFDQIVDPKLLVRRVNIAANHVVYERLFENRRKEAVQLDLFVDNEALTNLKKKEKERMEKERKVQLTVIDIKNKFGKNAILRGLNFKDGATAKDRNQQIGGHKA